MNRRTAIVLLAVAGLVMLGPTSDTRWPASKVWIASLSSTLATVLDNLAIADRFGICSLGLFAGGGYESTLDRYAWTCGNYSFTSIRGGGSGSYTTATVSGGVGRWIDCTAYAVPDVLCMVAGDRVKINAGSDIALAEDMTIPGGDIYLPIDDGYDNTIYQVGRCGETAAGAAHACPVLRAPYDTFEARTVTMTANRTLHLEGADLSGFDDKNRTGVWIVADNGRDDADSKDADGVVIPRRQNMVGPIVTTNRCGSAAGTTPDITCTPGTSTYNKPASAWAYSSEILGANSNPNTLCIRNDLPTTGMCEDDPRIACTSGGATCTARGLTSSCLGFADMVASVISDRADQPLPISYTGLNRDADGDIHSSSLSAMFWIASLEGSTCETDGEQVVLTNSPGPLANTGPWPFVNEEVGLHLSGEIGGISINDSTHIITKVAHGLKHRQGVFRIESSGDMPTESGGRDLEVTDLWVSYLTADTFKLSAEADLSPTLVFTDAGSGTIDLFPTDHNEIWMIEYDQEHSGLAYTGGTFSSAQSPEYGAVAEDAPVCSATYDGLVVTIVDDDGSCTHSTGDLTGGGSTINECLCIGATPSWEDYDCTCPDIYDTPSGSGPQTSCDDASSFCPDNFCDSDGTTEGGGSNRGCWDEPSIISTGLVANARVEDIHVDRVPRTPITETVHPIFDASVTATTMIFRDVLVTNTSGRLFDTGTAVLDGFTVQNATAIDAPLFSFGFYESGERVGPIWVQGAKARYIFTTARGSNLDISHIHIENTLSRSIFNVVGSNGIQISNVRGYGNYGRFMDISPTDLEYSGPISVKNVSLRAHQEFKLDVNYGGMDGFIVAHQNRGRHDYYDTPSGSGPQISGDPDGYSDHNGTTLMATNNYGAQTFTGPYIFDNVHFETKKAGCFLYFDETGTPMHFPRKTSITNSSIRSTHPTDATVRLVCSDDNDAAAQRAIGTSMSMAAIEDAGRMPFIQNSYEGGTRVTDHLIQCVAAADTEDCNNLHDGALVCIYDDTAQNACSHTSGVLNGHASPLNEIPWMDDLAAGTGKNLTSICRCDAATGNWNPAGA